MIWSYPRGEDISKDGETAIDVDAYATQIAALLGAHIIKVKLPTASSRPRTSLSCINKATLSSIRWPTAWRISAKPRSAGDAS